MSFQGKHFVLVKAEGFDAAAKLVCEFFDETLLLQYDSVNCQKEQSFAAVAPDFWQELESVIEQNRQVLTRFLKELENDGVGTVADLKGVSLGYQSKLLHIIAHFLDGFIGIDTVFYNLLEDSHWLSDTCRKSILATPAHFWLVSVDTAFVDRKIASFV